MDKTLTLPPLPYDYSALEPVISEAIMQLHHDKHHAAYVTGANAAAEKLKKYRQGEMEINVREVMRDYSFNYNGAVMHEIFWDNMRPPRETNEPEAMIGQGLTKDFGSVEIFKKEFSAAAGTVEGSGWAVLWQTDSGLLVGQLEKHNLLGLNGAKPILVLDVWEHAYYLDYQNNRAKYIEEWWKVVNWEDVSKRYEEK